MSSPLNTYAAIPSLSRRNSVSARANSAEPQSKQTLSSGNTKAAVLLRSSRPGKWMLISAPNSFWFSEPHNLQAIAASAAVKSRFHFCGPGKYGPLTGHDTFQIPSAGSSLLFWACDLGLSVSQITHSYEDIASKI